VGKAPILEFDEFVVPDCVAVNILAENIGVPMANLQELNPAFSYAVWEGKYLVPVGYTLRVPLEKRYEYLPKYETIPDDLKFAERRVTDTVAGRQLSSVPVPVVVP
jgi:hypothetical protein